MVPTNKTMYDYNWIKKLKKEHKINIPELLALHKKNDPFFTGSPSTRAEAEWFAGLWDKFGYKKGIHPRRVHYQLVSQSPLPQRPDGKPYKNNENSWDYLCDASKYARDLDLVSPHAFVDRRNPEPHIYHNAEDPPAPYMYKEFDLWPLPAINASVELDDWRWPKIFNYGYSYSEGRQPILLEIWVEKSTMDDVLLPLCEQYGVNLVTGLGFMSDPSAAILIDRIEKAGKPARILYISDYDPAGEGIPIAVARRIEFKLRKASSDLDIKLTPLALTREQVDHYGLPGIPIKDDDKRKEGWEARHGKESAVELDALEAKFPGELARIVREHVRQYRDNRLREKMWDAQTEADDRTEQAIEAIIAQYEAGQAELRGRIEAVMESYQGELKELADRFAEDMAQFKPEVESLQQATLKSLDEIDDSELPEVPEPELGEDDTAWLFDSSRDYFEQLAFYKKHRTNNHEE